MPRPNLSARGTTKGSVSQSRNPFRRWAENRQERRLQSEEEASRMIINDTAKNETTIIRNLESIDFDRSRFSTEILEAKTNPNQKWGDFEYVARGIANKLQKNPQTIKMDIRPFDQKLLTLVLLYKQTVEQGDLRAAHAAKAALTRAVFDIRCRIPQNQPELAKRFVEANTQYLDQWITLVTLAQTADRMQENVDEQRVEFDKAKKKDDAKTTELGERIREDDTFTEAFAKLNDRATTQDRSQWNDADREVHRMMVERAMDQAVLKLSSLLLHQQELELSTKISQVDVLYTKVASLKIVPDPNEMNKFQEAVDDLFKQLIESDAQIDETLKLMDDIEGRLQQLDRAPGALRAREVAAEQAERALEEITARQKEKAGQDALRAKKMRENMGILSEEELEEMKKQAEEEMQRSLEEQQEQEMLTN